MPDCKAGKVHHLWRWLTARQSYEGGDAHVSAFMLRAQVAIPWQPGDALLLDNARVQHSRESFKPPRRILASLVGTLSKSHGTLRWDA